MSSTEIVQPVIDAFIDEVGGALEDLATRSHAPTVHSLKDATNEAFQLSVAFIDVDGRHTDNELWALSGVFGPLMPDTQLSGATPAILRDTDLVKGRATWLQQPSSMFELFLAADAAHGTAHAEIYLRRALAVLHVLASLDDVASPREISAIGAFRSLLVERRKTSAPSAPTSTTPDSPLATPTPPREHLEDLLRELDGLVGLEAVKSEVKALTDLLRIAQLRRERNLPTVDTSLHMVFVGNPGTGKTTVARLLARIYRACGALEVGHLVETDRSGLVAGYVGQTAPRVAAKFTEADRGMLFIDEAYTLARGSESDFGREAIDQLVKCMEDARDRTAVIVAGYPDEMADFIGANPGLSSRFAKTIAFPDYSTEQLVDMFERTASKVAYRLSPEAKVALAERIDIEPRVKGFGNGRFARNLFEAAISRQASRLANVSTPSDEQLQVLLPADIPSQETLA